MKFILIFSIFLFVYGAYAASIHFKGGKTDVIVEPAPQVVQSNPTVTNCSTTNGVTVCQLTDSATERQWLIIQGSSGITAVSDDLR